MPGQARALVRSGTEVSAHFPSTLATLPPLVLPWSPVVSVTGNWQKKDSSYNLPTKWVAQPTLPHSGELPEQENYKSLRGVTEKPTHWHLASFPDKI